MKVIVLSFLILLVNNGFGQYSVVQLNSAIGDTISITEREKDHLFEGLIDSSVVATVILQKGNSYFLKNISSTDSSQLAVPYDKVVYYRKVLESKAVTPTDTTQRSVLIVNKTPQEVKAPLTNDELNEKMRKEAGRNQIMRMEADRQNLQGLERENYMNSGGGFIQFSK